MHKMFGPYLEQELNWISGFHMTEGATSHLAAIRSYNGPPEGFYDLGLGLW